MSEWFAAPWRVYPAAAMMAAGGLFALRGVRAKMRRAAELKDPWKAYELMQGFRFAVIGLSIAGLGAAWFWSIGWLAALSLIIGGEELLESSFAIAAVRNGPEAEALTKSRAAE